MVDERKNGKKEGRDKRRKERKKEGQIDGRKEGRKDRWMMERDECEMNVSKDYMDGVEERRKSIDDGQNEERENEWYVELRVDDGWWVDERKNWKKESRD